MNCFVAFELSFFVIVFFVLTADINKFLWMVRIGGSTEKGKHIKEHDYYTPSGEFRIDKEGSPTLLNCLMYKMCYYRFGSVYTEQGRFKFLFSMPLCCNKHRVRHPVLNFSIF